MTDASRKRTALIVCSAFLATAVWLLYAGLRSLAADYEHGDNACERTFDRLRRVHWASVAVGAPVSLAVVAGIAACCCRSSWDAFWRCVDDPCRSAYLFVKALLALLWLLMTAVLFALFAARRRCFEGSTPHAGRLLVAAAGFLSAALAVPVAALWARSERPRDSDA